MAQRALEQRVRNMELRVTNVEQILPTLATRADLQAAIAPLATKDELRATKTELEAAMATLATKAEMKAEGEQTRRHFDVVAERLHDDVRLIAEGLAGLQSHVDTRFDALAGTLAQQDRRLTRLEVSHSKRR